MLKRYLSLGFILILFNCQHYACSQTLDYFISKGLENSPLLKDFGNQLLSSGLDSLLVKASLKPAINASSQLMFAPYNDFLGYDEAVTNGADFSALMSSSQSFFNRKNSYYRFESIRLQQLNVKNSIKISENELKKLISGQYLTAYSDYTELEFNKSFLVLMNEEKEIIKNLAERGIYKQTDYLSFLIETQSQEIQLDQLQIQVENELRLLAEICGIDDTNRITLTKPILEIRTEPNLALSPLFLQYQLDSFRIVNEKNILKLNYSPRFNWFADAGFVSSDPFNIYRHVGISAGINFSIPVYDGKQRNLNDQKFEIQENTRWNYSEFYRKQYSLQLLQLNHELKSTKELLVKMQQQKLTSDQLIELSKIQLNSGNISVIDLINSLKNHSEINRNINQAQMKLLQLINELNYLL